MNITELHAAFQAARTGVPDTISARALPAHLSSIMDAWLMDCATAVVSDDSSTLLIAVGGYGRGELFPHSDVDLLVSLGEHDGTMSQDLLARTFFMPLWDAGFDVGHGMRTPTETFALASSDFEVLCAFLDARLLAGSVATFESLRRAFHESVLRPRIAELVQWLAERFEARLNPGADSAHLLAPNLKEGRGGLRDVQTVLWLDRMFVVVDPAHRSFLTPPEHTALQAHADFLATARVHLHALAKRKNDVLHLELQPAVAKAMGYERESRVEGIELFLSALHREMVEIKLLCRLTLNKALAELSRLSGMHPHGQADGLDFSVLAVDPLNLLELFHQSALTRIPIGWQTRRVIQNRFSVLASLDGWQAGVVSRFQDLLCSSFGPEALEQMLEIGFLSQFIPEFQAIEHLVQFDAYHMQPAGPHSVETVRQLAAFDCDHEFLGEQLCHLHDAPLLRWAGLLHDIGKGGGEDHSRRGAEMSRSILARFGFENPFIEDCAFLIEHHLLLVHTATRRDLGEESVILALAQILGSQSRLDALALLTWADSTATGPKAWNPWVQNLLRETYFKTRKILESGFLSNESRVHKLSKLRDTLRSLRPESYLVSEFEAFLSVMPPRYLSQTSPQRIIEHIHLVRSFRSRSPRPVFELVWEHKPKTKSLRLTFVSEDKPGLFARFCAALCRHGLSVLGAELNVWDDRTVVDVFWVTEPLDLLYVEEALASFRASLEPLFLSEDSIDQLPLNIAPRLKKFFALDQDLVRVHLDNEASDFYTVLSIQAPDVPGLLATVSFCLYRLGIDLVFAKIATQKDKAMDILHIREGGGKIPDAECSRLEQSLRLLICSLYA